MKPSHTRFLRAVFALVLLTGAAGAHAQLRLPQLNLPIPQRLGPLDTDQLRNPADRLLAAADTVNLRDLRLGQVGRLLRQHRDALEADPRGEPVVRREILAWSPSKAGLAAAAAAGLTVLREKPLEGLDEVMVVFRVPDQADTAAMLEKLRALDPAGSYDFNHIYTGSSAHPMDGVAAKPQDSPAVRAGRLQLGLVDGGVDGAHAVFHDTAIRRWGCDGGVHPSPHGTAVAALMVGRSERFRGVAPDATLFTADVYCDSATGGSADKIAGALAWLAKENIAVINLSLVGPPNQTLERVVGAMVRRGHLLVAAVGNDGPAAPPLYPASYPGVVGVSAVDGRGRILPEAARGPQVLFAAPGSNMVSAALGAPPYRPVRGTSFASPIVAAMLAGGLARPDPAGAKAAIATLAQRAGDGKTVSNERGYGVVGESFRVDPNSFR